MAMRSRRPKLAIPLALCAALLGGAAARDASAFCGFYVGGADTKLFNNATMVVMMREGTRTVLAMQNNYQGPAADFAMVVPVPVVLQKENVKTLPREVFDHVDTLAAPRLVEYWEQDPCTPPRSEEAPGVVYSPQPMPPSVAVAGKGDLGVRIEAQFTVGEYEVVVLSAQDSTGLDTWLHLNNYKIPEGAEPVLRPYVQSGMKFFVAKVDAKKVRFEGGMAMLSPLRFYYDTETFGLPVRLGLLNSAGTQDLIVHILARGKRYEVANYPNVTIPTNYDVAEAARDQFGAFYAALLDRTIAQTPGAVVTEYAWDANSCDPCPTPALEPDSIATLGADVLVDPNAPLRPPARPAINPYGFVLTRLHARYTRDALGQDLVFREVPAIEGGREDYSGGHQTHGAKVSGVNNFQARYAIRHPWPGPITCADPRRGVWGEPPQGVQGNTGAKPALKVAFAPRGQLDLVGFFREGVPELKIAAPAPTALSPEPGARGCGGCSVPGSERAARGASIVAALALLAPLARRRKSRASR
jgi:hypothetical protein